MTQQQDSGRFAWADVCRLIAMLGVVIIHVTAPIFYNYKNISEHDFLVATALDSLVRVSVPFFAMLSGALLLGRDMSKGLGGVVRRVMKVAIPLAFWSVLYMFWMNYWEGKPLSVVSALQNALRGPVIYHLWFVYMIIGVYILLPILQVLSVAMLANKRWAAYFFGVWFCVNSITIYFPLEIVPHLNLLDFLRWPGYFLLGFYLLRSDILDRVSVAVSLIVFFLASLVTFLITWKMSVWSGNAVETAFEYCSPNVMIAAVAAFHAISKLRLHRVLIRPAEFLSNIVFLVYLMHLLVIELVKGGMFGFHLNLVELSSFWTIISLSLTTFIISIGLACLIRIIPRSSMLFG
jgi:surface polysaccharide O-acyltransferase-like enzyme